MVSVLPDIEAMIVEFAVLTTKAPDPLLWISIEPVPRDTASLKVINMLLFTATPVAASVGLDAISVGGVVSA